MHGECQCAYCSLPQLTYGLQKFVYPVPIRLALPNINAVALAAGRHRFLFDDRGKTHECGGIHTLTERILKREGEKCAPKDLDRLVEGWTVNIAGRMFSYLSLQIDACAVHSGVASTKGVLLVCCRKGGAVADLACLASSHPEVAPKVITPVLWKTLCPLKQVRLRLAGGDKRERPQKRERSAHAEARAEARAEAPPPAKKRQVAVVEKKEEEEEEWLYDKTFTLDEPACKWTRTKIEDYIRCHQTDPPRLVRVAGYIPTTFHRGNPSLDVVFLHPNGKDEVPLIITATLMCAAYRAITLEAVRRGREAGVAGPVPLDLRQLP